MKTKLLLPLVIALGVFCGISGYTFYYGRGLSYLTDDPKTCINCHVMRDVFERWTHSSHKGVATCNACHIPNRFPNKWFVKGLNGWNHSRAFTTGNFEEPIHVTQFNTKVVERNCVRCHSMLVSDVHKSDKRPVRKSSMVFCIRCHPNTGHEK
jgi:cytochrome c nitrite reductase small subunit